VNPNRHASRDAGFTLVELLVVVAILAVIAAPLANVVVAYFRNTGATTAELTESHDAQIAAAYWAQDVSGLGTRSSSSPYGLLQSVDTTNSGTWAFPCTVAGATPVVRFVDDDYSLGTVRYAYVTLTVSGQLQLRRLTCVGSATPVTTVVLVHDVNPGSAPTVSCDVTCSGGTVPRTMTLNLSVKDAKDTGAYPVQLTGTRRQT